VTPCYLDAGSNVGRRPRLGAAQPLVEALRNTLWVRTRPAEVSDRALAGVLADRWSIDVDALSYRPLGFGSHHWELREGRRRWFLTVDDLDAKRRLAKDGRAAALARLRAALATARDLADAGLHFVVAPVPADDGAIVVGVDGRFVAALYPYIEGRASEGGDFASLSERLAVLDLVTQVHAAESRHALADDLSIAMDDQLHGAIDDLGKAWDSGPYAEPARRLLDRHAVPLLGLLEHHHRLAAAALDDRDRFVLTHGEPHPANTLVTAAGLRLIDWDTVLVAPPERDLWTVAGDDQRVLDAYTAATGTAVSAEVITCYRLSWDLNESALYIALLRNEHTATADVAESWRNLQHFLQPAARWPELC
jgi:hypothetical protein